MSTICAIATPAGMGGIAVVRVSGEEAIEVVNRVFSKDIRNLAPNRAIYGQITRDGEVLDDVIVTLFRAPHSYTSEDTAEISCHGSLYIQRTMIQWLLDAGATLAKPGEFTQRAFLNGKIDLTQAEAVADLIAAQTKAEKKLALNHLRGGISKELSLLREKLLHFAVLIELELDFADHEDLTFADRAELKTIAQEIDVRLRDLLNTFQQGNAIKNGINVVIVGKPNVGKSTLLNALLNEQRAIVSDTPGTTRDTIEETIVIDGQLFRLIDTAGLHETDDSLEQLGIERTQNAINKADIIIELRDATQPDASLISDAEKKGKKIITAYNKCDMLSQDAPLLLQDAVAISAKKSEIAPLLNELKKNIPPEPITTLISNARHYDAISRAQQAIQNVGNGIDNGASGEILALDLHDCTNALGEITGEITSQDVLNSIFEKFCIGK